MKMKNTDTENLLYSEERLLNKIVENKFKISLSNIN